MEIRLGYRAKDRISGFEGILVSREIPLTGSVRYCLEGQSVDGKCPEFQWCDEHVLQVDESGPAFTPPAIERVPVTLKLGQRGRDVVTGVAGMLTARWQSLTGCDRFAIQPPAKDDGRIPPAEYFEHTRITLLDDGALAFPPNAERDRRKPAGDRKSTRLNSSHVEIA